MFSTKGPWTIGRQKLTTYECTVALLERISAHLPIMEEGLVTAY
ncbi:hypothetical protein ABWK46_22250 [Peribacillus frigoritolerans]